MPVTLSQKREWLTILDYPQRPTDIADIFLGKIDSQPMVNRGHKIRHLNGSVRHEHSILVRRANHPATLYSRAGYRRAEAVGPVIPAGVHVNLRRSPELPCHNYKCRVEH